MHSTLYTCLLMLCIVGVYFNGCQTTDQQSDTSDLQQDDVGNIVQMSDTNDDDHFDRDAGQSANPHPKEASAWFTRKLIMTSRQPSADAIAQCKERIESVSSAATNLRSLEDVAAGLEGSVSANPRVFHWCFYQMMSDLDTKLSGDASLLEEKASLFMSRMKSLWVLSRALDASNSSSVYMKYLRTRYTEISQNVFGRRLESMNAEDFRLPAKDRGKSAASHDE